MANNLIDYWFVIDPASSKVEKILMLGPLGLLNRENSDWSVISRADSGLDESTEAKIYAYDWTSDSDPLPDDFTEEDLTPEVIRMFDKGELSESDLEGVAFLNYDGTTED